MTNDPAKAGIQVASLARSYGWAFTFMMFVWIFLLNMVSRDIREHGWSNVVQQMALELVVFLVFGPVIYIRARNWYRRDLEKLVGSIATEPSQQPT